MESKMEKASSSSKDSRWSLHGMTALVTGGSRGIGFISFPLFVYLFECFFVLQRSEMITIVSIVCGFSLSHC